MVSRAKIYFPPNFMSTTRFYDNSMSHINAMRAICPDIESIHVPETPVAGWRYEDENPYAAFLGAYLPEDHPPCEGITEEMADELAEWAENLKRLGIRPTIMFDWDRTLSQTEGIFVDEENFTERGLSIHFGGRRIDVTLHHVVTYLLGGEERFRMLRRTAERLEGSDIYIITNNSNCGGAKYSQNFVAHLARAIFGDLPDKNILCVKSRFYPNKAVFLKMNRGVSHICNSAQIQLSKAGSKRGRPRDGVSRGVARGKMGSIMQEKQQEEQAQERERPQDRERRAPPPIQREEEHTVPDLLEDF
jgi:hypothetical protein